jgi:Ca2+-transporting ATPase
MNIGEVLGSLNSGSNGLTEEEAKRRLLEVGLNELVVEKKANPLRLLIAQFKNILIMILIVATIFSAMMGELLDAAVILVIILASSGLGFIQEYRAEKAIEALRRMLSSTITAMRGGSEKEILSKELVPGDVVLLEAGDKIPADARLLEISNLHVDESSLTGESVPVSKRLDVLSPDAYVADRKNVVYSGTTVTYGRGKAVVTATGMATEFGKIAKEVATAVKEKTPLERRTENIGKWLGTVSLVACLAVAGFGILREYLTQGHLTTPFILEIVIFGIALAVAAVPEALPAIVTGTLAIGMHEMAKRNALVRKMPAVETLGCTTVICSDKTGTLTKGEMTVRRLFTGGQIVEITGVGYERKGELRPAEGYTNPGRELLSLLGQAAVLCNDARLEMNEGSWRVKGDPTEGALIVFAEKAGFRQDDIRNKYPRQGELPFSSERKRMSTVHPWSERGKRIVFAKGAPEVLLQGCSSIYSRSGVEELTEATRRDILAVNERMATDALRVLGLAYKEIPETLVDFDEESLERDLTLLGLMGIFKEGDIALTGDDLEKMINEELEEIVEKVTVYARVSPMHKLKIVKAWKKRGEVVAMTGDGVNDAPAIKHADIGIAMGITGTDVSKEASDVVLADDNFATIVKAVEQGRMIFDNIKKYLTYLLQCNLTEVLVIGGGVLAGLPLPLLPAQILWVNLVTDGAPALALGVSPPDPDIMERRPRNPKETIFSREVKIMLTAVPLTLSPILLLAFINDLDLGVGEARTTLFIAFVFFELVVALNCRSLNHSILKAKPHRYLSIAVLLSAIPTFIILLLPQTRDAFGMVIPTLNDVILASALSIFPLAILEALKLGLARRNSKPAQIL